MRYEDPNPWESREEESGIKNENRNLNYDVYYAAQKRKKKHTGLIVILAVLALLTGAASWAVNVLGIRVDVGQKGLLLAIGDIQQQTETAQPEQEEAFQPAEEMPAASPAAESEATPEPQDNAALALNQSPSSVETRPAEEENALSLQAIYAKVIPSVASISCVMSNGTSSGTGIVMSRDGYIITNYHVIDSAQAIYVLLEGAASYQAVLVGGDETSDLAVLKVEAEDLEPAEFGDSDVLRVGDMVVAIGDPLGAELRGTMTDGIVSAINRDLSLNGRQMTLIQTNAALNSGNSGGPLVNCYGQVIGINTMKMSSYSATSATVEGLGFAIPITAAKPIIDELIDQGYVSGRPAIGITGQTLDLRVQFFYHLPAGVIVTSVDEASDAHEKGLAADDVIVGFGESAIGSLEDLVKAKSQCLAGDVVTLTIYRGGRYYNVDVELMDQVTPDIY